MAFVCSSRTADGPATTPDEKPGSTSDTSCDDWTNEAGSYYASHSELASWTVRENIVYNGTASEHPDISHDQTNPPETSAGNDDTLSSYATAESQFFYTPVASEHVDLEREEHVTKITRLLAALGDIPLGFAIAFYRLFLQYPAVHGNGWLDPESWREAIIARSYTVIEGLVPQDIGSNIADPNNHSHPPTPGYLQRTQYLSNMSALQGSAKVIDWVEQQALGDQEGNTNTVAGLDKEVHQPLAKNPEGRVYDITTLLNICATVDLSNIHLRIHQGALHEHVFKATNTLPATRRQVRSRGLSEMSQQSIGSNDDDVVLGNRFLYPVRQPHAPPESIVGQKQGFRHRPIRQPLKPPPNLIGARVEGFLTFPQKLPSRQPISPPELAQQHAGFQRFLKEHASPPHHRVTAGGRIVPNTGPPPMFNVNSLTGAIKSPTRPNSTTATNVAKGNGASKTAASSPGPLFASAASKHGIVVSSATEQPAAVQNTAPREYRKDQSTRPQSSQQSQPNTPFQYPPNTMPVILPQDGTTFVMQNGLPHRVYSNGLNTFAEPVPLLFTQQSAVPGLSRAIRPQSSMSFQTNAPLQYAGIPNVPSMTSNSGLNSYLAHSGQENHDQVAALQQHHEHLRSELQGLDRHIALHGKRFGSQEQLAFVTLRKQLVQHLDQYRRQLSRSSSSDTASQPYQYTALGTHYSTCQSAGRNTVNNSCGATRLSNPTSSLDNRTPALSKPSKEAPGESLPETASTGVAQPQKTPSVKSNVGTTKVLSPEAAPFIPGDSRADTARKVESCIPNAEAKDAPPEIYSTAASRGVQPSVRQISSSFVPNKENVMPTQASKGLSHVRDGTSGSAMEPLVPEIHEKDIAYVDAMALNPIYGAKKYCSTVVEFQEVIRRVREQARLYGCKGGSSKDPEFDAEQDIRWAISDTTPIPLPKKVPDHIVHPRPWYWNDSTFNIQADRSGLRNINSDNNQQATTGSTPKDAIFASGNIKANSGDTTPKGSSHLKEESPTDNKTLGPLVRMQQPSKPETGFVWKSARQAAILRETQKVLGIIPSNALASNTDFGTILNQQRNRMLAPGMATQSERILNDFSESSKDTETVEREKMKNPSVEPGFMSPDDVFPVSRPIVRLPSGPSYATRGPNPDLMSHKMRNSQQELSRTPSSSTSYGNSSFLGTLLKSPRYSSASLNKHEPTRSATDSLATQTQEIAPRTKKENTMSEMSSHAGGYPTATRPASTYQTPYCYQDPGFGKSRSSVAPTTTYARAQMHPQSGRPGGPFQSLEWEIRHHAPSPGNSSHGAYSSATSTPYRQRSMPQYDGADDETLRRSAPGASEETSRQMKARSDKHAELDPRVFRTDTNELPGGHEYAVDGFLKRLKQAENKDMAKHPPKGRK